MKKMFLLSITLFLLSCNSIRPVVCKNKKEVTLTWNRSESKSIDIYVEDSLSIPNIPCVGTNRLTMHDVNPGDYTFVFKSDGRVIEKKRIIVVDK